MDESTGDYVEIKKTFPNKSTPQGSILSPKLWRYYDGLFSRLYTNSLADLVARSAVLKDFWHFSYADDHLTILLVEIEEDSFDNALEINQIIQETRSLLDRSCVAIGAALNWDKSEVVVDKKWAPWILAAKSEFVWLGYSFECTRTDILNFTTKKLVGKQQKLLKMCRTFAGLKLNPLTLLKIYNVYIRPIIEVFSMNHNIISDLGAFQERLLRALFNLPRATNGKAILKKLNILSARDIFEKSASRIMSRHQDIVEEFKAMETRTLRDGSKSILGLGNDAAMRRDFFTALYLITDGRSTELKAQEKSNQLNNLQLTKWCIKLRKRVALLIRRKKARNRRVRMNILTRV